MADVYKIGVSIAMTNGVSSVLKVIQKDLLGLNGAVDVTAGKFDRLKVAMIGGMTALSGIAMLDGFKKLAEAGGKLLDQQLMISNGTTQVDLAREMATAYNMVGIGGSTLTDNLKMVADLRQLLGSTNLGEAISLAPGMMKAGIAAGLLTGVNAEKAGFNISDRRQHRHDGQSADR